MGFLKKIFYVDPEVYYQKGFNADIRGDKKKAAIYYEMAANDGHLNAKFALGVIYIKLDSKFKEHDEGKKLLREAATLGHEEAKKWVSIFDKPVS